MADLTSVKTKTIIDFPDVPGVSLFKARAVDQGESPQSNANGTDVLEERTLFRSHTLPIRSRKSMLLELSGQFVSHFRGRVIGDRL